MTARKTPAAADTTALPEVEGIDLDAWLAGAKPITDSVRVTSKLHLVSRIEELEAEMKAATEERDPVERSAADPAPVDPSEEYKALVREYLESFRKFTFRARLPGDMDEIRKAMKADKADTNSVDESQLYMTAHYSVEPKLTAQSVRRLADAIGGAQYDRLVACWFRLSTSVPEIKAPK